jgi:hypothetical protein
MRSLLMFKGAHEIASLSWFFCVMTKEQNQYQYRNISSNGNIAQHIKIISCPIYKPAQFQFYEKGCIWAGEGI